MFTGIVERTGRLIEKRPLGDDPADGIRLTFEADPVPGLPDWETPELGASIAINGVCLTTVESAEARCSFDAVPETLRLTTLGDLAAGDRANLERALAVGERFGGHYVSGHVDGTGTLRERILEGEQVLFDIETTPALIAQMIGKGSITVEGVSLTLVEVRRAESRFTFAAIPHTLEVTNLGERRPGDRMNLETDAYGKWVLHGLRQIFGQDPDGAEPAPEDLREKLREILG